MNNKKKILVILVAIFVCSGMFFISDIIKYSNNSRNATTAKSEVKSSGSQDHDTDINLDSDKETTEDSTVANTKQDSDKPLENKNTTTENIEKTQLTQQTTTNEESQKQEQPKPQSSRVIIQNGITGKTILSRSINANNKSVGEVTTDELDRNGVDYKATGFGPTLYMASIAGLSEKAEGPTSGWTYFVQKGGSGSFVKPGVSCGSYKLQEGDVVLWKYVKEGA